MYCQNLSHNYSTGGKEGVAPFTGPFTLKSEWAGMQLE